MGTLAENVMSGAQEAQNQQGQTMGTAVQAYQTQQSLEINKQKLAMDQQKNEQDKATNFMGQMNTLAGMPPEVRKTVLPGMTKTWQQMYPDMDVNFPKELADPNYGNQIMQTASRAFQLMREGHDPGPDGYKAINAIPGQTSEQRWAGIQKAQEDYTKIQVAKNSPQLVKAQNQQDALAEQVASKFDQHPALTLLTGMGNKLDNDKSLLTSSGPDHPVTNQAVNEVIRNIATVLGNGTVSDSSTDSISTHLKSADAAKLQAYATDNPNIPASPELIKFGLNMVNRLNTNVGNQVVAKTNQIAQSRENAAFFHNPTLAALAKNKADFYRQGKWRAGYSDGQAPTQAAQTPTSAAAPVASAPTNPYGNSEKEIKANYDAYLATQAHKDAGGL